MSARRGPVEVVTVEVEMLAYADGAIRRVDLPREEFMNLRPSAQLELVFRLGQNEFQPKPFPSVSVGDVIRLHGSRYRVAAFGFDRVGPVEWPASGSCGLCGEPDGPGEGPFLCAGCARTFDTA